MIFCRHYEHTQSMSNDVEFNWLVSLLLLNDSSQTLQKKHEAFESDLEVHKQRVGDIRAVGEKLISEVCFRCSRLGTIFPISVMNLGRILALVANIFGYVLFVFTVLMESFRQKSLLFLHF